MQSSVRVVFYPPSEREFSNLLRGAHHPTGSGLGDIQTIKFASPTTRLHQRGGGFFSSLANIAKSAVPFLFRTIAPSAMKFTRDVVHDVTSGHSDLRGALKKRGIEALKGVGSRIMKGGKKNRSRLPSKKKKKRQRKTVKKKKKKTRTCNGNLDDVFDMI